MNRSGIIVTTRPSRPPITIIARIVCASAGGQARRPARLRTGSAATRQDADDEQPEGGDQHERGVVARASATGATMTAEAMKP